jgi:signal transduction histidine kinase
LSFGGGIQHNVIYAVRDGKVDAGSVRTGMLEKMAQEGRIQLETFKVLEPRKTEGFGFSHSSRLYPEWPLAKLSYTPDELAHQVEKALYAITPDSEVAKAGKYFGWGAPLDYEPVNALLKELALGPYKASGEITFKKTVQAYWKYALLFMGGFTVVALIALWVLLSNRQLKKVTQQLKDYQDHLEDMVATRTAELVASNRELESYSYSIAHDLRGPLRSLVGFSQILEHEAAKKLNEGELDAIERIVKSGKQMAEIIDDILDLSRISRGAVTKEMVDMSSICHELAQHLNEQDQNRKVNWIVDDDLKSNGDKPLLRVMLQNLLENAWKFTRDVANPDIEVGQKNFNGVNTFYVRDNGIGFDMHFVDKIYLPFHRLHRSEFEGTGIGLAIVQRVVERHGGKLWADSIPSEGATFYFTLTPDTASDE